ncbi:XPA protein C-terminus-domain-containing protein [Cladochytrium replicatum]|nr:XPA protein C-terminus-domain-containing protein [Cladochytrium replicatum]
MSSSPAKSLSKNDLIRIEQNRLKAEAKLREREENFMRQQNEREKAKARAEGKEQDGKDAEKSDEKSGKGTNKRTIDLTYCEYNLSTMQDSRGGFIYEEFDEEELKRRKVEEEKKKNAESVEGVVDFTKQYKCRECSALDVDLSYIKHYDVCVCRACKDLYPDKYSLLTKTECREDYLLTESELRDQERLPHWIKANPHKSTWSNMLLYMREQVEAFAWEKWGSPEALDREFERREAEKAQKKDKKFRAKLLELKKKTRTSTWQRPTVEAHEHDWGDPVLDEDTGGHVQLCSICASSIAVEIL